MDAVGDPPILGEEAPPGGVRRQRDPHPTGEQAQRVRRLGQGVGLELVEDLQPVLDVPEKDQRVPEQAAQPGGQIAALGEAEQGAQRVPAAQPGIVARVEELQRLGQELHLADAAAPELHVAPLGALGPLRAVDLPLHVADVGHDARVEAGAEHEGPDQL